MFWHEVLSHLRSGGKVRRSKWKPAIHLIYKTDEKRTYVYSFKKHKYKPWYSDEDDLTTASDWEIVNEGENQNGSKIL